MKRKLVLLVTLLVILSLAVVAPAHADKPAPKLSGPMEIAFDPPVPGIAVCDLDVFWYGTVELDGEFYGMTFKAAGESVFAGMTQHYWEQFMIYDGDFDTFPTTCPDSGERVLEGDLSGVGRFSNGKIVEHGTVTYAVGPFEGWEGRRMHADGLVEDLAPGVPAGFTGIIRFN